MAQDEIICETVTEDGLTISVYADDLITFSPPSGMAVELNRNGLKAFITMLIGAEYLTTKQARAVEALTAEA